MITELLIEKAGKYSPADEEQSEKSFEFQQLSSKNLN
jgi:hypothetical protein